MYTILLLYFYSEKVKLKYTVFLMVFSQLFLVLQSNITNNTRVKLLHVEKCTRIHFR